ncbi:uncharacterized protein CIMG_07307 [Coccidioides immitis RS]|uniref:Increased loss of mitochondrial DNA protein 1 n=1 Tax=Coccidioides immitis (strain RS) TaxID=246410 RepID=J3KA24_COCIM|nr:uncharacterized protein CIMG_07307 [Coccidioides immitis RS]EAS31828.3 hypothetical protein CIMG_07307 [Coccidioides immitis RS]
MSRLSSRSFIKLHALFQFALAAYLTWSPEVITDSGLVYYVQDELKIFDIPPFSRPRSPFALCGILLLIFALVDLTLAIKLPALNRILTIAHCIRRDAAAAAARQPRTEGQLAGEPDPSVTDAAVKVATEFTSLYVHLCMLLTTLRFWIFFFVSLKVYFSPESVWAGKVGLAALDSVGNPTAAAAAAPGGVKMTLVEELKSKIVLGYGVMEIMFSCWFFIALNDERRATEYKHRSLVSGIL